MWAGTGRGRLAGLLVALALAACSPCNEVIEATADLDGGFDAGSSSYCAADCSTTADCAAGFHCSQIANGSGGLCVRNFR